MQYRIAALAIALLVPALSYGQSYPRVRRSTSKANAGAPEKAPTPTMEGTLKMLSSKEILIQLQSDQLVSIRRNHKTKFVENDKQIDPAKIEAGTPLAIDVKEDLDLKPMAVRVVVNPPPPKASDKSDNSK